MGGHLWVCAGQIGQTHHGSTLKTTSVVPTEGQCVWIWVCGPLCLSFEHPPARHPLPNRHHHPAPLLPKLCLKCCCFLFRPVYCANKRRLPDPCTTCPVRSLFIVSASQRSFKATPGHCSSHHFDFAGHLKQTDSNYENLPIRFRLLMENISTWS